MAKLKIEEIQKWCFEMYLFFMICRNCRIVACCGILQQIEAYCDAFCYCRVRVQSEGIAWIGAGKSWDMSQYVAIVCEMSQDVARYG